MKSILNALSQYFETVPDQVRRRKLLVWLFFIATTVFMVIGMGRIKFDLTIEGWFEKNDPTLVALDEFHAEFGSDDGVFIVYKPKDGNVFSSKSLETVKGIREDLLNSILSLKEGEDPALKHIIKITTLINAPILTAQGDLLISKHLMGTTIPTSQQELEEIRRTAESQKTFPLLYFSKDLKYGGIYVETDFGAIPVDAESPAGKESKFGDDLKMDDMTKGGDVPEERIKFKATDLNEYLDLMNEINLILNKPEYASHLKYYPVGNAAVQKYEVEKGNEMVLLYLAAIIIMMVLLWFFFRSLSALVWPMTIVILSTIWTIGLAGWLGLSVTGYLFLTVMLILTIGIADSVHVMSGYLFCRNKGYEHKSALRIVYQKTAVACLLTAITTSIGILALNITPIVPVQIFAFMSSAGVVLAYLFTLYLLPLMLDLWSPVKVEKAQPNRLGTFISRIVPNFSPFLQKILDKILPIVEKRPLAFIFIFLAFFGICIYGATKVKVDTDMIKQYPENSQIRGNYEIVDQKMMGAQNMEIYLDLGTEYAFQDPSVLNIMDELQQKMEKKYSKLVVRTSSLVDIVKDAYQVLNEGREEMYIIPENPKVLSQTLFLFDNANPEDRRKVVSDDYRKSHISVQLRNAGSYEYSKVFDLMRKDIDEAVATLKQEYPNTKVTITGMLALLMKGADYITWSEIQSFGIALIVITIVLLLVFGSIKAGLTAIIPNLIPATLTLGLIGWFDIALDFNIMMIAPIIVGIAVDDTVHFIAQYRAEVFDDGNIKRALLHTMKETGQAVTFTSLALGLGFGIMAIATSPGTASIGKFGFLAIFVGVLCDLFLLPSMILFFKLRFQRKSALQPNVLTMPLPTEEV